MREYILRVILIGFITTLGEMLLPEGNMRKFAAPILGLATVAAIVLPAASWITGAEDVLLPAIEKTASTAAYGDAVLEEYRAKIIAEIEREGGSVSELVIGKDYKIEAVTLRPPVETRTIFYLTSKLGVKRSAVKIQSS